MGRLELKIGGADFTEVLTGNPAIKDMTNSCCRALTFSVEQIKNPQQLLGYETELLYNGARWFKGEIKSHDITAKGERSFNVYDPLFYSGKNPDDFYFKNQTGTQIFRTLSNACNIKVANIANMGYTFPYLYYQGAPPDKVMIDVLARTYAANGKKFWYRYDPVKDGLIVFERSVPSMIWAFQLGNNITAASKSDSIEDMCTVVKVVNRETGASVVKEDATNKLHYGKTQYFEEVNSNVTNLESYAASKLKELNKVSTTMALTGINPDAQMEQFYSGDCIYVEEPNTGMAGGYFIKDVTHTFLASDCVQLDFDVVYTPDLPVIQFNEADKKD